MSPTLLDPIGTSSESRGPEVHTGPASSPDEASALASRFIQLSCRPEHLAPVILDFLSLSLSIIWTERQPGPDFFYPLSSLKKRRSGRLARLLLEHSRDQQLHNLHNASSPRNGVDPPCVAVIDLDEVPPEIIKRGYTVSADFYGFVVMVLFFQSLIPFLHVFSPHYEWLGEWMPSWFGDRFAAWVSFCVGLVSRTVIQWTKNTIPSFFLCVYAVIRGEGTLSLVRRSDTSTPGSAVLLDRDFIVILTGTQNIAEAIAESSFSMSHTLPRRHQLVLWKYSRDLCYGALKASCQGFPYALLGRFWMIGPASLLMAFVPLVPAVVASLVRARIYTLLVLGPIVQEGLAMLPSRSTAPAAESLLGIIYRQATSLPGLIYGQAASLVGIMYSWAVGGVYLFLGVPTIWHYGFPVLDILGQPPVRKWEFDTLAAAATFQCLVLCRGIPRPIKSIDVLTLLDTFIPDERDVWKVWKARVADRIAHEEDISFAPNLPSFGDRRQKHLKELLDEAQIGYGVYRDFYDWHVPLHSTIAL